MPRKTLKVRVKDRHAGLLRAMSREVNVVWNYCNDLSYRMVRERGVWMRAFDFHSYTVGASREFEHIGISTIQEVSELFAVKRRVARKARLRWRKSYGARRSLGWVPFKSRAASWKQGQIFFAGQHFGVWDSYGLSEYKFRAGSFTEDARGRWYFCVVVDAPVEKGRGRDAVGVDLGLKDIATCSDGFTLEAGRWYRDQEKQLSVAQRARKTNRARAINAKIANRRKDALHKFSRKLVNRCSHIVVGDVASAKLKKTKMAKSVSDAGWHSLKTMLKYKCEHAGVVYEEVNEANTTQTCSSCGAIPDSSPKGRAGLEMRAWDCGECGAHHDRDVNAAQNILALGSRHGPPVEGIAA